MGKINLELEQEDLSSLEDSLYLLEKKCVDKYAREKLEAYMNAKKPPKTKKLRVKKAKGRSTQRRD